MSVCVCALYFVAVMMQVFKIYYCMFWELPTFRLSVWWSIFIFVLCGFICYYFYSDVTFTLLALFLFGSQLLLVNKLLQLLVFFFFLFRFFFSSSVNCVVFCYAKWLLHINLCQRKGRDVIGAGWWKALHFLWKWNYFYKGSSVIWYKWDM